ncbi:MAG: hypothetical protein PHV82_05680 [Victivallaceae bacterium]|nr:hypothetical protein [Victivallaceae bacterium]
MSKLDLEKISIQRFSDLLENLDKTETGENLFLRCYPDGGSYISNDSGNVDYEFNNFSELIQFLMGKSND